ncbi:Plant protein of unknown function (DUF247) [Abeliophyllum distichum]|uniref:Uncharacterized protein n=1 Tax=Abeliophyllum distichum TaxID=126358 RepID=A0ABD1U3X2_9LAMI
MEDHATEMELWKKRSIYRIPSQVTDANMEAYKPHVASFGPYHHGEHHLRPMEDHKQRALLHFLRRSGKRVEFYVDALANVLQDLKDAYDQLDIRWQEDERAFLQLMLLDGCFILEIMQTTVPPSLSSHSLDIRWQDNDYAPNDPIFSAHGKLHIMPLLRSDMLLIGFFFSLLPFLG